MDKRQALNLENFIMEECDSIKKKAGEKEVVLLISGGVDSTVTAALLLKALPQNQVHLMYINTGLMRKNESTEVMSILARLGAVHIHKIEAEDFFLSRLRSVLDPEEKRRIIGDAFIACQEKAVNDLGLSEYFLAQGTIYPDIAESEKTAGSGSALIKSHHNVGTPMVAKKRAEGMVIEPLASLYKPEVRELGLALGLPRDIVFRHPFPGPGLGVRVMGEVTKEKLDILREADEVFISELKNRRLYDRIWQAFCVLLDQASVGIKDGRRSYCRTVAIRAVNSNDATKADVYPFEFKDLLDISRAISSSVPEIGRVVYDISGKPPATIEWE